MKYVLMDLKRLDSMKNVHAFLEKELEFPEYYGHNLDALYDCLTDIDAPVTIILMNVPENSDALEGRLEGLLNVFESASTENSNIVVKAI
ncbi:MAG: barstar family protein [Firmicutes bacterium]|nr:barstar family protein [Bacillota bacterium]